jgi:hypothetical protein
MERSHTIEWSLGDAPGRWMAWRIMQSKRDRFGGTS